MKKIPRNDYHQKTLLELRTALAATQKKLIDTKIKHLTGNHKDTSIFKKIKYEIALISTLISEKIKSNDTRQNQR
jgi:ribosomal protein L29